MSWHQLNVQYWEDAGKQGGNKTWRKYWHALWQAVTFAAGNYSNIWDTQDEEVYTIVNRSDTRKYES